MRDSLFRKKFSSRQFLPRALAPIFCSCYIHPLAKANNYHDLFVYNTELQLDIGLNPALTRNTYQCFNLLFVRSNYVRKSNSAVKAAKSFQSSDRSAAGNTDAGPPGYQQQSRPGCFCLGRHLFHSLCHRGNPCHSGSDRDDGLFRIVRSHCHRDFHFANYRHRLLSANDICLPERWRRLYCRSGKSRGDGCLGCGFRPSD